VVFALLRGDEAVEGGDSILVNDLDVCRGFGLVWRVWAASEDMLAKAAIKRTL
jgi:hypothetical protein